MEDSKKTVLVGITGCIAAYKACELVRLLQKAGLRVKVVMTPHACEFVGPTTFRALTNEPVAVELFDEPGAAIHHVSLAQECDLFVVAPCTANVIAKLRCGIADDLLTTTALATTSPILIAPAMNVHMYKNAVTQGNIECLKNRGFQFVEPEVGYLACGDTGAGRLASPETICEHTLQLLGLTQDMQGMNVLITAGPTQEYIDPVRYLSNPSSGKTGFALAEAAKRRGADVVLITGPVSLSDPEGVNMVRVRSALEMKSAVDSAFTESDIAIFSAAVSDYKPAHTEDHKLKKGVDDAKLSQIVLEKNPDILAEAAANKRAGQVVVGFAAETDDVLGNAKRKLLSKQADLIVANKVGIGEGFRSDDNEITLVSAHGVKACERASKQQLANLILDEALSIAK